MYRPSSWGNRCFLGVAGSLKSAGGEHLETPPPTPPPPESTNWTCLWVYMTNTQYMSALCEQGMTYLHEHTHIYIYMYYIYIYRPSSWEHRCFLGVAGGLKSAGGEHLETPPRTPVISTPHMSALCEQGMIYLHKHTHIYIYLYTPSSWGHRCFLGVAGSLKSVHDQYSIHVSTV